MFLALAAVSHAGVLLNEVLYVTSQSGGDAGYEWIELCNNGTRTVDLTGYALQSGGSSWSESYTFASATIAPGEYVLVGYGSTLFPGTFSPNLQNAGSATDGVRLVDTTGAPVDTLLYDTPNDNALTDDLGVAGTSFADTTGDDESLGRWPNCTDSGLSAVDFAVYVTPSPGVLNIEPASGGDDTGTSSSTADCTGANDVVINELVYATDVEWIELYNSGSASIVLDGWTFQYGTSSYASSKEIPAGTTLEPGGLLVIGSPGAAIKDFELDMDLGNATSTADGVRLVCDGAAVDSVVYGSPNTDNFVDDSDAIATSLAPEAGSGASLQRAPNGIDTDQCGADFVADPLPSPGTANTALPAIVTDCSGSGDVVINEFTAVTGFEWIEIHNRGSTSLSVEGWVLEFGTSSFNNTAALPRDRVIPADGYLVVGSAGATYKDVELDLQDLGNASNADGLRLTCDALAIDTVIYGGTNSDNWMDDSGAVATSIAPDPTSDGFTVARSPDGVDTNASGDDFGLLEPSPGAANPDPPPCTVAGGEALKINEVQYDPSDDDSEYEWIELYNAGSTALSVSGYVLEQAKSSWGSAYMFPADAEIPAGGYLLVGAASAEVDYVADSLDLGQGSGGDGVRMLDCEGTVLDTLLYGDALEDEILGDAGSIEVVPGSSEGASLGRFPDGGDTNAAADWHAYGTPTPGAANTDPADIGGGDGGDGPKGCGKSTAPGGGAAPGGGCTTVLPLGGLEAALAALALARRRRQGAFSE